MHDTIFWYRKTDKKENFIWNQQYEELSESSKRQWKGKLRVDKTTEKGTRYSETSEKKSPGVPMSDVWIISQITAPFKEYRGYPTQKPEALVERIIKASSNEGDIVLDPFCGGGTTLAVAKRLKRKFIGIDISRTACRLARERLGKGVKIFGDETLEEVKKMNPHDVAELIIVDRWDGIISPKKSRDFGIDGWVENRTIPVQVKRWEHKVGRPEVDKFKTAVERDNKKKGIIVADGFSKDSYAEVARIKAKHGIDIELVEFKTIFETHNKSHNHNHGKIYIDHPLMMIF
jgi:SAM-dependent methyltransferase